MGMPSFYSIVLFSPAVLLDLFSPAGPLVFFSRLPCQAAAVSTPDIHRMCLHVSSSISSSSSSSGSSSINTTFYHWSNCRSALYPRIACGVFVGGQGREVAVARLHNLGAVAATWLRTLRPSLMETERFTANALLASDTHATLATAVVEAQYARRSSVHARASAPVRDAYTEIWRDHHHVRVVRERTLTRGLEHAPLSRLLMEDAAEWPVKKTAAITGSASPLRGHVPADDATRIGDVSVRRVREFLLVCDICRGKDQRGTRKKGGIRFGFEFGFGFGFRSLAGSDLFFFFNGCVGGCIGHEGRSYYLFYFLHHIP